MQYLLALAVVTEATRFEHRRQAQFGYRIAQSVQAFHSEAGAGGDVQFGEQLFFQQAVLRHLQRCRRRRNGRAGRHGGQCRRRYVFKFEGQEIRAFGQFAEHGRIVESPTYVSAQRGGGGRLGRVQELKSHAQRVAGQRQHPAQLTGADHPDTHVRRRVPGADPGRPAQRRFGGARKVSSASRVAGYFSCQDRGRQQGGIARPGLADGQRGHRHAGRHLHDGQQRIDAVEHFRFHRHAQHRQGGLGGRHAGQVRGAAGAGNDALPGRVRARWRNTRTTGPGCDGPKPRAPRTECRALRVGWRCATGWTSQTANP